MNERELRIGNLVYVNWDEGKKIETNWGVFDLPKGAMYGIEYEGLRMSTTPKGYCVKIDRVEAIPLTEEWLVKFGFRNTAIKWNDGSVFESVWQLKNKYSIEFTNDGVNFFLFFGQQGNPVFINYTNYVHQLQNLYYALTGEELTIK